jgi:hypothetical protein
MEEGLQVELVMPFSPLIVRASMPVYLVDKLNSIVDELMQNDDEVKKRDLTSHLAGNIQMAIGVVDILRDNLELWNFINCVATIFALKSASLRLIQSGESAGDKVDFGIALKQAWINEMIAGDFNPVHFHPECDMSCVGFLRVPNCITVGSASAPKDKNGILHFIDGRTAMGAANMHLVRPLVGELYMFPWWLLHTVYPFKGDGVRRSFSANLSISIEKN